jgi:hypothetical protein
MERVLHRKKEAALKRLGDVAEEGVEQAEAAQPAKPGGKAKSPPRKAAEKKAPAKKKYSRKPSGKKTEAKAAPKKAAKKAPNKKKG